MTNLHPAPPRVLVPLVTGFEELEAIAIIDILRRGNLTVVTAAMADSSEPSPLVTGSHQITVQADTTLATLLAQEDPLTTFAALVLPGGPGVASLVEDARLLGLVQGFVAQQKWVGAICAAPLVLSRAGVLGDRQATSFPAVADQLAVGVYRTERVVTDGRLITSRGAGTAVEFALHLLAHLQSPAIAHQVAESIVAAPDLGAALSSLASAS